MVERTAGPGESRRRASILHLDHDGRNVGTVVSELDSNPISFTTHGGSVYWTTDTGAVKRVAAD